MKNNKLVMIMLILLVAIALAGTVAIVLVLNQNGQDKNAEPTIDEVLEASVDIPELTTNLAENDFIRISFKIQTDSIEAKEELEKRSFQVNNIIILELSEQSAATIKGREGQLQLEENLKVSINEIMQEGEVEKVYITQFLLQ
ncbi:flagellar basal body-associated protein FliL [Niallia endozanthoxylica]|uniref:Flagellar protein FliL n=1 Tax=Niallia endozanthoxylica TaxID=2036016 RepID=A0A5J5HTL1_9BACI|nr:flagellar basal body-associated protein FliL [Niallia endozanthoxylica]KAA9025869.1 flagellar basal body-associated protein FliL [Niallia endozanthoxylica]